MIELKNVTRRYADNTVLENLCCTLPKSGMIALMGPSGCGKTTLLRLLAGLDRPDEGEITNDFARVSFAFQEPRLAPFLTVEENVKLVLPKTPERDRIVSDWLAAMELSEVRGAYPRTLSGGMQQRLSLARALAFGGDLLLLDEPFSALDEALKARIIPLIAAANPTGLTVLVTHDRADAERLGATILTLPKLSSS